MKELIKMIDVRNISSKIFYWVLLFVAITPSLLLSQDPPEEFQYEQSTLQAFYFFTSALDLQGNLIESTDWVAAFNGDICVGARQWNLDDCGGLCDVPVMGDDGESWSSGYMVNGDIPTFKIYDSSEDIYYDAVPSQSTMLLTRLWRPVPAVRAIS